MAINHVACDSALPINAVAAIVVDRVAANDDLIRGPAVGIDDDPVLLTGDVVAAHERDEAGDLDAGAGVVGDCVAGDGDICRMADHAGAQGNIRAALVVQPVADDASMVIGSAQENAVAGIAVDVAIGHGEAGAAGRVGGVHSVLAAGQTEMIKRRVVSPGELDHFAAVR